MRQGYRGDAGGGGGGGYEAPLMRSGHGSEEGMYQRHRGSSGGGDRRSPVQPSGYNPRRGDEGLYDTSGRNQKGYYPHPIERPQDGGIGNEPAYSKFDSPQHFYDPPQEKYGNEQDYPGNDQGHRQFRNEQDYYRKDQDYSPREKFDDGRGYREQPYHRDDPYHQGGPGGHPQDQQVRAGGGAMGGAGAGGGATGGAEGGGAMGGASGGGGEPTDEFPKMKSLCATVGCSYKGYKELQDLCPDCYREHYDPDFNDSQEFPLV